MGKKKKWHPGKGNSPLDSLAKKVRQKFFLDKDPIERLRKSESLSKIRGYVDTAVSIAKTINEMGENPSLRNYVALATIGIGKILSLNGVDFHADKSFDEPPFGKFARQLQKLLRDKGDTQIFQGPDGPGHTVQVSKIYGETIVFSYTSENMEMFYVVQEDEEEDENTLYQPIRVRNALGRVVWETYGNHIKLILDDDKNCIFEKWDLGERLSSPQTEALIERIRKFRDADINRTIMLYGSPGTGKSSMARAVAKDFGYPTVFIEASSAKRLATHHLYGVIALLCPGILIVDDFDHLKSSDELLTLMNEMGASVSIFIATINDLLSMNPAVIRAGRFDEIEEVERILSPAERFPQFPAHIAERIDQWPIAFIVELSKRMKVLGPECVDEECDKLAARVKRNKVKHNTGFETFLEMLKKEKESVRLKKTTSGKVAIVDKLLEEIDENLEESIDEKEVEKRVGDLIDKLKEKMENDKEYGEKKCGVEEDEDDDDDY